MNADYHPLPGSAVIRTSCRIRRTCILGILAGIAVVFCVVLVSLIPNHHANTDGPNDAYVMREIKKIQNQLAVASHGQQNFCTLPASVAAFTPERFDGTWYEIARLQTPGVKVLRDCHCTQIRYAMNGRRGKLDYTCANQKLQGVTGSGAVQGTMKKTRLEGVWILNVSNRAVLWSVPIQTDDLAVVQECDRELSPSQDDYYSATRILSRTPRSLDEIQSEFLNFLHEYMGYSQTAFAISSLDKCTF